MTGAFRQTARENQTTTKGNPMKPVNRYQSQLLFRRSYKPTRFGRTRPAPGLSRLFRSIRGFNLRRDSKP